jgi:tetratricopeptide (TPR) repeat protein
MTTKTPLRVLIQNRPTTFSQRGGDTVQIERLSSGLRSRGCDVTVDVTGTIDPKGFNLVHLFNLATTEYTEHLAKRAHQAGVPYVVTTLYEDLPEFHNQSHLVAQYLVDYVRSGQDRNWWETTILDLSKATRASRFAADWIISHASGLFPNGPTEAASIERDFPDARHFYDIPLGHEVGAIVGPELFVQEYGVKDFVLSVGRFESRKNQLMLLKALEDSDLTVVLASGGFTYQPEYDAAVRGFQRRGKTVIVEQITAEMLSSAYAACRVHALPSWYELPGHVSLEAAAHGKNIVITSSGTQLDYFGRKAFYCQPWDPDTVLEAVMEAFESPVSSGLVDVAMGYSWEKTVEKTLQAYQDVVSREGIMSTSDFESNELDLVIGRAQTAIHKGEFAAAEKLLEKASAMSPCSVRVMKGQGELFMATGRMKEAATVLERALIEATHDSSLVAAYRACVAQQNISSPGSTVTVVSSEKSTMPKAIGTTIGQSIDAKNETHSVKQYDKLSSGIPSSNSSIGVGVSVVAPSDLVSLLAEAESASIGGLFDKAHQILDRVLSIDPKHLRALRSKATTLLAQQRAIEAIPYFDLVLTQDAQDARALTGLGMSRVALKQHDVAYSLLVKALSIEPHQLVAMINLVECSYILGRFDDLTAALKKHLTVYTNDKDMRYCFAAALFKSGMRADAEQEVTRVLKEDPNHRGAQELVDAMRKDVCLSTDTPPIKEELDHRIGELEGLKRRQQYTTVLQMCDELLRYSMPDRSLREKIMILKAESHALSGEEEDAKRVYTSVLEANPQSSRALSGQGALAAFRSGWDNAEQLFGQARDLDDLNDAAWAGLGLCARNKSDWETAWTHFERSLSINRENLGALYAAIDVGYHLHKLDRIERLIKNYLELYSSDLEMQYALGDCLIAQGKASEAENCLIAIGTAEPRGERYRQLSVKIAELKVGADARR